MIKEYNLNFYGSSSTTTDRDLYEKYVDQMYQIAIDCGLFTRVEKVKPEEPPETNPYEAYRVSAYIDDVEVIRFDLTGAPVSFSGSPGTISLQHHRLTAYYNNGQNSYSIRPITDSFNYAVGMGFRKAYVTSNGILIRIREYYASSYGSTINAYGTAMISRSNKRYPIVVGPIGSGNYTSNTRRDTTSCHKYDVLSVCYADESYMLSGGYYGNARLIYQYATTAKQTMLFPFIAYGAPNYDYTYSKYACWMPFTSNAIRNGGLQKVLVNGKAYVTDGYFALRDD